MASKGSSPRTSAAAAAPEPNASPPAATVVPVATKAMTKSVIVKTPAIDVAPVPVAPALVTAEALPVVTPQEPEIVPQPEAAPAAIALEKEAITMDATIHAAADKAQTEAKTMFNDVNDRAKSALEKGSKMVEDVNEFSKGNVEAIVESSKIAARGAEEVAKYTTDYVKATVEKANAAARNFASIKSPTELFKLQSEYAKEAMDSLMAETAKFTENYLKLLGEIAQPLSTRVAVAAEKMKIAA